MLVVGLMSGTSADGIDAVLVEFKGKPYKPKWKILNAISIAYPLSIRKQILQLGQGQKIDSKHWLQLSEEITELNAKAAIACDPESKAALIGCHGQTVFHRSPKDSQRGASLQILQGPLLANILNRTVIYDFRSKDIFLGGHGAPLVPLVDESLIGRVYGWRGILNLGGIANLTIIPPKSGFEKRSFSFGWDCGPANSLIDLAIEETSNSLLKFDKNGNQASKGIPKTNVIEEWLKEPFFQQEPPRSTGREQFGLIDLRNRQSQLGEISNEDLLSTLTTFTASIVAQDLDFLFMRRKIRLVELLVAGGGSQNIFLVKQLQRKCRGICVKNINAIGLPSQFREGLAFATLAWWNILGLKVDSSQITGAKQPLTFGVRVDP